MLAAADALAGVLIRVTPPYCVWRLVKSVPGVTVLLSVEIVTMPNSPAALVAGKYENAIPPVQTVFMSVPNITGTSAQVRGETVLQPNSLK